MSGKAGRLRWLSKDSSEPARMTVWAQWRTHPRKMRASLVPAATGEHGTGE